MLAFALPALLTSQGCGDQQATLDQAEGPITPAAPMSPAASEDVEVLGPDGETRRIQLRPIDNLALAAEAVAEAVRKRLAH